MFDRIDEAIEDIKLGKMVIVVDDEDRENEGDFIMAAELATPDDINFMATKGRGLICTPLSKKRAAKLELPLMIEANSCVHETAFTVSIDSIHAGTGISTRDRAITISAICNEDTMPAEFVRPGHIFPLIAKDGGVLTRAGHTEAAVDLASLGGLKPIGVICEIMDEDGTMARVPRLKVLAKEWGLKLITIKDLIEYRRAQSDEVIEETPLIKKVSEIEFPNKFGEFKLNLFESLTQNNVQHVALVKGELDSEPTLVRVHSECLTGDIFGSLRCDCGDQLANSMKMIEKEGKGVVLYLRNHEGRGIGLKNKIKAYKLQDEGFDTISANHKLGFKSDLREYGVGASILKELGLKKLKLLTNNPKKIVGIEGFDLEVVERCSIEVEANDVNYNYLKTKKEKMGHLLNSIH